MKRFNNLSLSAQVALLLVVGVAVTGVLAVGIQMAPNTMTRWFLILTPLAVALAFTIAYALGIFGKRKPRFLRLHDLMRAYVAANFGANEELGLRWNGKVTNLPVYAGGFVDARALYVHPDGGLISVDAQTLLSGQPPASATAFVYRLGQPDRPDVRLGVILFGDERDAPRPTTLTPLRIREYFLAEDHRTGHLPAWATNLNR